jgi:hypothetical protein
MKIPFRGCEVFIKKASMLETTFLVLVPHIEGLRGEARNELVSEQRHFIEIAIREKLERESSK